MKKYFYITLIALAFLTGNALADNYYSISNDDKSHLKKAFYYLQKKKYDQARFEAEQASDKDIIKLVLWHQYQKDYKGNNYKDIADFITENPDWPRIKLLRNRAELSLDFDMPPEEILGYFADNEPITGQAMRLLAEAMLATGNLEVDALLRQAWIQGDFKHDDEESFLKQHGDRLRVEDHVKRIDRLLWELKTSAAKRIVSKVDRDYKNLFLARIYLIENRRGVDGAIGSIPKELQKYPGLLYDRIKWHLKRRNYHRIYEIIPDIKGESSYQDKWWDIRSRVARELIEEKKYQQAYNIIKDNGNESGSVDYAESEWLAGWLALRFLGDQRTAYQHFYNMYQNVGYPVSRARGAYWAGRAAEANENYDIAGRWYRVAAKNPTTFYGQASYLKVYSNQEVKLPDLPVADYNESIEFKRNDLLKIAYLLTNVDEYRDAKRFVIAAISATDSPEEMAVISQFGNMVERPDLSVVAAKYALREGVILRDTGWPVLNNIPRSEVENPLVHGIIRQESSFDKDARSHAKASGLMQLIPSTAKHVSRQIKERYRSSKLTSDPEYNMRLGSHYISGLIDKFEGSYILAIASYNAGPHNVKKWIKTYGDPRKISTAEGVIDWIELVPFAETRNYLQRVLENTQVYRNLTRGVSFALEQDLVRVNTVLSDK